jgi:glutamyl-tRNA synthetase/glutamyl-Q tRNA(Asp) synthetase
MVITRFAPSPTGFLHLGHVRNAREVWTFARAHGGQVLLRIEDHDRQRCKPEYVAAIREDLAWLGFVADREVPPQSERDAAYRDALAPLVAQGLVFGCVCTRDAVRRHDASAIHPSVMHEPRYPGTCRDLGIGPGDGVNWRIRMAPGMEHFHDLRLGPQSQDPAEQCGDVMIRDRLGNWTYQWAAAIDDYLQGVTHVIRGEDLVESTGRQIRLARLAGRAAPATFLHHALIMQPPDGNTPGRKLSKSNDDTGIRELRARGLSRSQVIALS